MPRCHRRLPLRSHSGSPRGRISTPPASGCRRVRPGMRFSRRSTTGARAGRAGSSGASRPRPHGVRSHGLSGYRRRRWPSARRSRVLSGSWPRRCRTDRAFSRPDVEFTSTLFPFLVQAHRGVTVRTVPATELADAIDDATDVVAFSAVQMATGEVADLTRIAAAAQAHGALTLVDATQACGWLPLDGYGFDLVVVAGYKWLLSPRGTAYMAVAPERLDGIVPTAAGWYAGEDVHASYFGGRCGSRPTRAASTPRPPGTAGSAQHPPSRCSRRSGSARSTRTTSGLANRFRAGLGLEPGDSAIVFVDVADAAARLERAGIRAAVRGGRVRTSWHLYNTDGRIVRSKRSGRALASLRATAAPGERLKPLPALTPGGVEQRVPAVELHPWTPVRLAGGALGGVDRLPALVGDDGDVPLSEELLDAAVWWAPIARPDPGPQRPRAGARPSRLHPSCSCR